MEQLKKLLSYYSCIKHIDIYSSLSETYIDIKINENEYIADKLIYGDFLQKIKTRFFYCTFSIEWI